MMCSSSESLVSGNITKYLHVTPHHGPFQPSGLHDSPTEGNELIRLYMYASIL